MPATVRVVVVTWDSADVLPAFLATLPAATSRPYEVVVVDNASPSGAPEGDFRLVETGGNLGYGKAANLGASGFDGDWLVVSNPDVSWSPGALDTLLEAAERWPRAGCLGPAITTPGGALYPSARAFPSLGRGIGHALLGPFWPTNPWTRSYRAEAGSPVEGMTGWLSGSCMLLRREAWEQVGGFDPKYFMYCEDMDLCRRIAEVGWQNTYVPSAVVTHVGGASTKAVSREMLREHHKALYTYLSEHYPGLRWAPLRALLAVGLAARWVLASRVRTVGEGAAPTRSANLLDSAETQNLLEGS
ncbi:MAG: N-acetylglucosaminyl-diphospho-decaprenol L-rhamnosyltransferase [Frankiales bacterium]|nr:N-acetylglucosaminyl-diphospho-decaprenol L-rhamnosyltransferase [Frankiales bacterium]